MEELIYWIAITSTFGIGPKRQHILLNTFGNPKDVFNASPETLAGISGVDSTCIKAIKDGFDLVKINDQLKIANEKGVNLITINDSRYPPLLKEITYAPLLLYVLGNIKDEDKNSVGVVGTRKNSNYAKTAITTIIKDLVKNNVTIVSGLARGIDTIAHKATLENNGRTIAVLGCGIDVCYPPENINLMMNIINNGAVVSEFPIGTFPDVYTFPRRNRIISGLSKITLVAEAPEKSGALITADFALDQGRDIFAIPGPITEKSFEGCNKLIQSGAGLVMNAKDILLALNGSTGMLPDAKIKKEHVLHLDNNEQKVFTHLSSLAVHIDLLSEKCNMASNSVLGILLGMELRGIVTQLAGKNFVKA